MYYYYLLVFGTCRVAPSSMCSSIWTLYVHNMYIYELTCISFLLYSVASWLAVSSRIEGVIVGCGPSKCIPRSKVIIKYQLTYYNKCHHATSASTPQYARKKHPFASYTAAKHPNAANLRLQKYYKKPVDFLITPHGRRL